ncbi:hypothetical protein KUV85_10935 [Nocardioides panacisoli]|uniref:ABC transporter permease n=1 Tax=Nocardioides panacisoli TaxID=627624 RepID=UPI001C62ABAB|nr:hypothetical protein [Nocardioides panacisoli]QYJ02849.1 hypothetical protein KUV85_10935 [Nocardioides panacisoli]
MSAVRAQTAGTGHLVRLILRRDRIRLLVWVLGFGALTSVSALSSKALYDTPRKIAGYGETVSSSAAGRFMNGRPYDVDNLSGIVSYELSSAAAVVTGLMVVFLVVRHTRAEEESGRAELLRGGVLGRHAHTVSAVSVAVAASLAFGVVDAGLLIATGLDPGGSVLHGASVTGIGLVFTGVAALAAQLTSSARGALGIAGGTLGVFFAIRGVGDVNGTFWTWLSPLGWAQAIRPYGDPQWWPVLALLGLAGAVLLGAGVLTAHRDEGSGLWQARPGRPRARAGLGTSVGLALRLQRGLVLGWLVFLVGMSALFGSFAGEVESLVEDNPEMAEIFAAQSGTLVDGFFAYTVGFMAVITSAFTLASALRLRSEENDGRAEIVLARGQSRVGWAVGSLVVTVLATLVAFALTGFASGAAHWLVTGESDRMASLTGAALAQAPAALLVGAIGVLLHGAVPRWALLAWVVFGFAMLQNYLGGLLQLPDAVAGLSPFWHQPQLPVEELALAPGGVLLALALLAAAAGLWRFRERDLVAH